MRCFVRRAAQVALVLGTGCPRPPARLDLPERTATEPDVEQEVEVVERPRPPPLPIREALDLVPAQALAVAHVPSWAELMSRLGRDRWAGQHRERYDELAHEFVEELGIDPFDPTQLPRIGIDPTGPAGFALLGIEPLAGTVYFRVLDPQVLRGWLTSRVGAQQIDVTRIGEAEVMRLRDKAGIAFVLRRDFCAFVFSEPSERATRDFAAVMAEGDARRSINHDPRFSRLLAELPTPAHFVGLFDPAGTLERVMGERERVGLERTLGELTAIGGALVLANGQVSVHGVTMLPEGSPLRRLLGSGSAAAMLRGLTAKPVAIVAANSPVEPALQMLERLVALDGISPEELRREFASEIGLPLDEAVAALDGEIGVALMQASVPKKADREAIQDSYALVAVAGLRDAPGASRLLSAFAHRPESGIVWDAKLEAFVLDRGDWHPILLAVIGDRLVATTEREAIRQLRSTKPVALDRFVADGQLRALLQRPGAFAAYVDALAPVLEDLYLPAPAVAVDPVTDHPRLDSAELARVPKSKRYRATYREYEQLLVRRNRSQQKRAQAQLDHALAIARAVGRVGVHARSSELGFAFDVEWKLGVDDLAALTHAIGGRARGDADDYAREGKLDERRWQIESELRELRTREIDAYLAGRGAP